MNKDAEKNIASGIIELFVTENLPVEDVVVSNNKQYTSIKLFETIALRIKCGKRKSYISVNPALKDILKDFPDLKTETIKSDSWIRIPIFTWDRPSNLYPLFLRMYDDAYLISNAEQFSCCSMYIECSDAKQCVNPDQLLARGCAYKVNLLNGKIFYGKNKIV